MNVCSVGGAASVAASNAAGSGNPVQSQMAVTVLKKAQQADAELTRLLVASATGVGQKLDVQG